MDSLDHIQNRILWIQDPKGFFTTDAPDGCEYSQPYSRNNFDTYSSCLTTLLIFKAIFEVGASICGIHLWDIVKSRRRNLALLLLRVLLLAFIVLLQNKNTSLAENGENLISAQPQ